MEQCESSQLSTSHLSESDPVLPMELFSKIIDLLGRRPAGSPLPQNQSAVLRTCALVCRSFAQLARDQLFHHITIGLHFRAKNRFMRFSQALQENDTLSASVQNLVIWLDSFEGGMISEEHFDRHKDVLSNFPRLKSLTVLFNSRFTSPPASYISSFCYHLINHYSTQQMLRSLHVKTMDELPYNSIFKSPTLREIRLDRCLELENWEAPVPGLQKLALRKMDIEPSYIAYFPDLTALELLRTNFFEQEEDKSDSYLSLQKFSVTHLTLEPSSYHGGKFLPFITFVRRQATKHGFRPFEDVQYLKVILSHLVPDLETLLQDTVRLTHFTLQIDAPEELSHAQIATELKFWARTLLSLTPILERLSLDLNVKHCTELYNQLMDRIIDLFTTPTITNPHFLHNNLHRLDLSFQLDGSRAYLDTTKPWLAIETMLPLMRSTRFPMLEETNAIISFLDLYISEPYLATSFRKLAEKGNFVLNLQFEEIVHDELSHRVTATYRCCPTQK